VHYEYLSSELFHAYSCKEYMYRLPKTFIQVFILIFSKFLARQQPLQTSHPAPEHYHLQHTAYHIGTKCTPAQLFV
jgi:hypothetical protein